MIIFDKVLRKANWKVQEWKNVLQNFPNEFSENFDTYPIRLDIHLLQIKACCCTIVIAMLVIIHEARNY
jgi:hypothetical protein